MIEPRGNSTLTEAVLTVEHDLEITGIRFQGDLTRPRYPSLFQYPPDSEALQFEPALQILREPERKIRILFQLDPREGVEFETDDQGRPRVLPVVDPDDLSGVTAELLDSMTCELTWDQLAAPLDKVNALRLLCRVPGVDRTPREVVYGGVYLAIVNRHEEAGISLGISVGEPQQKDTIQVLGTDGFGRPVYDLFRSANQSTLPPHLCLEPAFRFHQDEPAVALVFQVVDSPRSNLRLLGEPGDPEKLSIEGFAPDGWPPELLEAKRSERGDEGTVVWQPRATGPERNGEVFTFFLRATDDTRFWGFWRKTHVLHLGLDPTVIQPPTCSGGICI